MQLSDLERLDNEMEELTNRMDNTARKAVEDSKSWLDIHWSFGMAFSVSHLSSYIFWLVNYLFGIVVFVIIYTFLA